MNKSKAKKMTEKLSGKIEESPMRIVLNQIEVKSVLAEIRKNLDKAILFEEFGLGVNLYHLDLGYYKYYIDYDTKKDEIYYFVRYCILSFKNVRPMQGVRQCLVWRNKAIRHFTTAGLAKTIFWDRLFKDHQCCISDSQQSQDGEGFWDLAVKEALEKGLTVKVHNTANWTFEVIENSIQYQQKKDEVYGSKSFYQRYIISIEG